MICEPKKLGRFTRGAQASWEGSIRRSRSQDERGCLETGEGGEREGQDDIKRVSDRV